MTLVDALSRLRAAPDDGEAWATVRATLPPLAARVTDDVSLRDVAVARVFQKLEDQLLSGDLEPIGSPVAYLSKALRWRVVDEVRRRAREAAAVERNARAEAARAAAAVAEGPPTAETLEVLERAFQRARTQRDPWQRDHLDHAWRQILAIHLEGRPLRELVAAELPGPADPEAVRLGVQRAHKAHERARREVLAALDWLVARRLLDAESAADARRAMMSLRRRQQRPRSGVSGAGEAEDAP